MYPKFSYIGGKTKKRFIKNKIKKYKIHIKTIIYFIFLIEKKYKLKTYLLVLHLSVSHQTTTTQVSI